MEKPKEIQDYLTVGYIYLVILGILNETMFYNQISVNILEYSDIFDILISPIAKLTSSYLSLALFILIVWTAYFLPKTIVRKKSADWIRETYRIEKSVQPTKFEAIILQKTVYLVAVMLLFFYVGTGLGKGLKTAQNIENNVYKYNDKIHFITDKVENVKILGINSAYIFYLKEDSRQVLISPISGIVKSIEDVKKSVQPKKQIKTKEEVKKAPADSSKTK